MPEAKYQSAQFPDKSEEVKKFRAELENSLMPNWGLQFYASMLLDKGGAYVYLKNALDRLPPQSMRELESNLLDEICGARYNKKSSTQSKAKTHKEVVFSSPPVMQEWSNLAVGEEWVFDGGQDSGVLRRLQKYASIFASRKGIVLRSTIANGRIVVKRLPDDTDKTAPNSKHNFHLMEVGSTMVLTGDHKETTRKAAQIYAARKGIKIASKSSNGTIILTRTA